MTPMETPKIKREIVAVFMESPLYFTIPLKRRLEFIIYFIHHYESPDKNKHSPTSLADVKASLYSKNLKSSSPQMPAQAMQIISVISWNF
jgi:hypothetical protein